MMFNLLKEMFNEMVIKKDASKIPLYYHPQFQLYTNGQTWDYERFFDMHVETYQTAIQYTLRYDEETVVEGEERIAARIWITTKRPNEEANELEVMLIATYKEGKIYRLWELTWPDWSQLKAFQ